MYPETTALKLTPGAPSIRVLCEWVGDHEPRWRLFQFMLDSVLPLQETLLATVSGQCERGPSAAGSRFHKRRGEYLRDRLFGACNCVLKKYHRLYSTRYKVAFAHKCAFCTHFSAIQVVLQLHSFGRRKHTLQSSQAATRHNSQQDKVTDDAPSEAQRK
jgi:hypothetical protein